MEHVDSSFCSQTVTQEKPEELIRNLDSKKIVQSTDIPTKSVKKCGCLFSKYITTSISKCISEGIYVDTFKKAAVHPEE